MSSVELYILRVSNISPSIEVLVFVVIFLSSGSLLIKNNVHLLEFYISCRVRNNTSIIKTVYHELVIVQVILANSNQNKKIERRKMETS